MKPEQYKPSVEEVKKAEEMLTPEKKEESEVRAKFKFQKRDPFDDFIGLAEIDKNDERRKATSEEVKEMDADLQKLGNIFSNSGVRWQLDGAFNISLMRGEYIGVHKDVDISIESDDLEKLDNHLGREGYGLFISLYEKKDGKKIMERVGASDFREISIEKGNLMIAAIDSQGKIHDEASLNFIDVHLISRNEQGVPLGVNEVELPKEWLESRPIYFKGEKINLSHPARVAYYKIHSGRTYDSTDLKLLIETGRIFEEDVEKISELIKIEHKLWLRGENEKMMRRVVGRIEPEMVADKIFSVFLEEELIAKRVNGGDKELAEILRRLSEKISENENKSFEAVKAMILEITGKSKCFENENKKVDYLRRWIKEKSVT